MTFHATHFPALSPDFRLEPDEVHVWCADLRQLAGRAAEFELILSPEERQKAARFYFADDRERYVSARGLLRTLLGAYLRKPPAELSFSYNAWGKPALSDCALEFNLSHSRDLALYALARDRAVGIDVEFIRDDPACLEIAEGHFSRREVKTLRALHRSQRAPAFFNCWTRKEALIKAQGQGLSLPLNAFDVSLAPGEPAALLNVEAAARELSRWSLQALTPAPNYVAAVAAIGGGWRLCCRQWPSHPLPNLEE